MHVSKLTFKRGVSAREGKNENLAWQEASIEITLNEGDNPDLARETARTYFQAWGLEIGKITTKQASKEPKRKCEWRGCDKLIDPKFKYCYPHFQQLRGKQA